MMLLSQRKQSLCWQWLLLLFLAALSLDALPSQQQRQQRLFRASNVSWTSSVSNGRFQTDKDRSSKQRPFGVRRLLAFQHRHQQQTFDEGDDSSQQTPTNDKEEAVFGQEKYSDADERRLIKISSQIELPFSAEVAYDAYSDLPRQPTWSSWLESVEILNSATSGSQKVQSKWTSKIMGIRYSWKAEAVRNDRPHTIQWKSVSGLRNEGIVKFAPQSSEMTLMTLQMNFVTPRAVTALIKRSKKLTKFVQETMIAQSLQDFKEVVLAETENTATKSSSSSSLF